MDDVTPMLQAPLMSLAVLICEGATAMEHAEATTGVDPADLLEVEDMLATATAVWAVRRRAAGRLTMRQALELVDVIADARAYVTERPAELAAHDQQFAAFCERMRWTE